MHLTYWKMELKRACRQIPNMIFGAIMLAGLLGMIALLSGRMLYGDAVSGRVTVGVVLPEDDAVAKQAVSMISSLDSVRSLCDFQYLEQAEGERRMEQGELYALMKIPEGFVRDIMDGTNTPVTIVFPEQAGLESGLFQALADAGAKLLASAQAGIYAGNELCRTYGLEGSIAELEQDLNRIFLSYSLPRSDYFRHYRVSGTGDVDTLQFYGISIFVLFLLLSVIPVSAYLLPWSTVMRQKLSLAGIGAMSRTFGRILGLTGLLLLPALLAAFAAVASGVLPGGQSGVGFGGPGGAGGGATYVLLVVLMLVCICLGVAAFVMLLYQIAGSLMGGIMLLFLVVTGQHFLAGGFLPQVFLPGTMQAAAPFLPSALWMDGVKMMVTAQWDAAGFVKILLPALIGFLITAALEVRAE